MLMAFFAPLCCSSASHTAATAVSDEHVVEFATAVSDEHVVKLAFNHWDVAAAHYQCGLVL